mgnify:CR=1 FL=1
MSEAPHAPEGQVIEGRYRVVSRIADGGMATVYQAVDERLERTVAIKIMHTQLAQGPHRDQFVERFHREARSAAAIANPHIVQVYDTGEFDGLDYLVMEYVHGVRSAFERRYALLARHWMASLPHIVRAWCIATSSRKTSCLTTVAMYRSPISAWLKRYRRPHSPPPAYCWEQQHI